MGLYVCLMYDMMYILKAMTIVIVQDKIPPCSLDLIARQLQQKLRVVGVRGFYLLIASFLS